MYDREDRLRKSSSSSFSKSSPRVIRTTSLSSNKHSQNGDEELEESSMLERVLERMPTGDAEWKMISVEQKRNIPGFKSRLEWMWRPRDIKSLFKFSFTSSFFNQVGTICEGDLIIQLEEVTFEMSLDDKILIQETIEGIISRNIEVMKGRGFGQEWRKQNDYLRQVLIDLGEEVRKMSETKKKVPVDRIDQKLINKRQIMYPAPATFSWNPLGSLCVTENRFPSMRRPLIGQPSALKKYFQIGRQDLNNGAGNGDDEEDVHTGKAGKSTVYDWQIDEEVDMIIFKPQDKTNEYFNSRSPVENDAMQRGEEQKGDEDTVDLGSLSRLPFKLKKAYERYFGGGERPGQFHRYDKLKVYDILSLSRQEEDDIVFLIDRITARPAGTSSAEVAFQNHLTAYPCLFQGRLDRLRYEILTKMLIKDLANPHVAFGAYLRVFVLENCFFANEIQIYFRQQYRILGRIPHPQLYGLGSYCKFDNAKTELIFMDLLKYFLIRADEFANIKVRGIHARRRSCPMRLSIDLVVSDEEKNKFLMGLFPLLIVKDREMQRFQFKKIKKIVSANARATSFIKKMNELVVKMEEGRYSFLKTVVEEFFKFRQDLDQSQLQPQRVFLTSCSNCHKETRYYALPTCEEAETCHRCKIRSFSEIM